MCPLKHTLHTSRHPIYILLSTDTKAFQGCIPALCQILNTVLITTLTVPLHHPQLASYSCTYAQLCLVAKFASSLPAFPAFFGPYSPFGFRFSDISNLSYFFLSHSLAVRLISFLNLLGFSLSFSSLSLTLLAPSLLLFILLHFFYKFPSFLTLFCFLYFFPDSLFIFPLQSSFSSLTSFLLYVQTLRDYFYIFLPFFLFLLCSSDTVKGNQIRMKKYVNKKKPAAGNCRKRKSW